MAVPCEDILAKFTPERLAEIEAGAAAFIRDERERQAIREVLAQARSRVAGKLGVEPGEAARLEAEAERYLLALRKVVREAGGRLDLVARFPGRKPARVVKLAEMEVWPDRKARKRGRKPDDAGKVRASPPSRLPDRQHPPRFRIVASGPASPTDGVIGDPRPQGRVDGGRGMGYGPPRIGPIGRPAPVF